MQKNKIIIYISVEIFHSVGIRYLTKKGIFVKKDFEYWLHMAYR